MQTKSLSDSSLAILNSFPRLIIHAEDGDQLFPLNSDDFWTIGRGYDNKIVLHLDESVSRYHATLYIVGSNALEGSDRERRTLTRDSGTYYLSDLGSRNGCYINEQRINSPTALKNGDRFAIGKTVMEFYTPHKWEHRSGFVDPKTTIPVSRLPSAMLTPSEERVFWQVVQGFTNKEIGKRLQISPRTVQTHLSSIMTKLNLENRSQIVRFAFEHNYPHSTAR